LRFVEEFLVWRLSSVSIDVLFNIGGGLEIFEESRGVKGFEHPKQVFDNCVHSDEED